MGSINKKVFWIITNIYKKRKGRMLNYISPKKFPNRNNNCTIKYTIKRKKRKRNKFKFEI